MPDGGMGSLRLSHTERPNPDQIFHKELAVCQFHDVDGALVIASFYANKQGQPFELDMWKVDVGPLIRIPEKFDVYEVNVLS